MKMMKPKRCPKQALFMLATTVLMVLLSAYSIQIAPNLTLYFRLIGGVALAIGAALLFRYTMTTYVYVLEDNCFSVRRSMGFNERTVFSKELKKGDRLLVKHELKKMKPKKRKSFRQNLSANCAYIVFSDVSLCVEIEPNDQFFQIIEAALININK